jgi:hypothetical protein
MGLIPLVDPDCFQIEPERQDMAAIANYPQKMSTGGKLPLNHFCDQCGDFTWASFLSSGD